MISKAKEFWIIIKIMAIKIKHTKTARHEKVFPAHYYMKH